MSMPPIPIQRYLTPEDKPRAPEGFTQVDATIRAGLPHTIQLDQETSLVVVVSSGLAVTWRDIDPATVVSRSNEELAPGTPHPDAPVGGVERTPARLLLRQAGQTVAVTPLVAGLRRLLPDAGEPGRGVRLELVILEWDIRAGSMRGAGDFGSRLSLAWRRADQAVAAYSTPPPHPHLVPRLKPQFRMWSRLGLIRVTPLSRFLIKKVVLK